MAPRWTFKEDYTICKFVDEHDIFISSQEFSDLTVMLKELGFERSENAIFKRVRDFQYLLTGQNTNKITDQERIVSKSFVYGSHIAETYRWIDRYVEEVYRPNGMDDEHAFLMDDNLNNNSQFLSIEQLEVKQSFYEVFHELLDNYYAKHKTGKKTLGAVKKEFRDSLVINYCVSGNTFDAIRRQKYDTVSRKILFRLCFALELDYVNAKRLLESVGFDFRRNVKEEVVVEAILKCESPRRFIIGEIDETLEKNGCNRLFS